LFLCIENILQIDIPIWHPNLVTTFDQINETLPFEGNKVLKVLV